MMAEEPNSESEGKGWSRAALGISAFPDPSLERMYQSYRLKQKRAGLKSFLFAALCLDAFVGATRTWAPASWLSIAGAILAAVLFAIEVIGKCHYGGRTIAGISWMAAALSLPAAPPAICPMTFIYLLLVALPLRLRYGLLLTVLTAILHGLGLQFLTEHDDTIAQQHICNGILMTVAALLGLLGFLLDDRQQRQAFLETRQSLEVKLLIEEQSAEQERLLLSVLPEHVAVKMRQDLGSTDTQFKKIYMSRHENVSILYADIVGFTAISSTYSAQDLVAILNELFARFDRLAEKYQQLRIKILGDCYYCISGAPVERPDHAVLCIRMGLAMVKSIKYLQQTTNSPVDMRVGIHTGAILAGVLGQRQWQFDVYSRDVELANKMESSGMAGRVHISEKTLSFLDGEFEVEPAYGEKREEALRLAGIKTYFIVKVLKPFNEGKADDNNGNGKDHKPNNVCKKGEDGEGVEVLADVPSDTKDEGDSMKSPVDEEKDAPGNKNKEDTDESNKRLRKELVKRDGNKLLAEHTGILLGFKSDEMEAAYKRRGALGLAVGAPLAAAVLLPSLVLLAATAAVAQPPLAIVLAITATSLMVLIAAPFVAHNRPECERMSVLGRKMSSSPELRLIATAAAITLLTLHNVAQMIVCTGAAESNKECAWGCAIAGCGGGVLAAALAALAPLPLLARAALAVLAGAPPALISYFRLGELLSCWNYSTFELLELPSKHYLYIMMGLIALSLIVLSKHLEGTSRILFLWKGQIEEQRERAADMRRRNEALVYNVLPPHVAVHFMGQRRRQHNELYSQSYAEVGVLFASMPNFAEFYSEETVNNQGLECLRFLNEVISDFDALLEKPPFKDIIKIKTIGSTYMAATGLDPSRQIKSDDPVTVRWCHLSLLVEFALELKQALQGINEQSFNHFVLKMGINHGPITAGVIGARKPHYDIWGNTVNVASRMESTGKAGCIQVTEETSNILRNFGYKFEQRGLVSVKGKGQLLTYYLLGKDCPEPASEGAVASQPSDVTTSQNGTADVSQINFEPQNVSPIINGIPKSPNGSIPAINYNGVNQMSPSNRDSTHREIVTNEETGKLLHKDDSSHDLNIDARESDALLKN